MRTLIFVTTALAAFAAQAATEPLQIKPNHISSALDAGSTIGGRSADEFSLLSVKNDATPEGERLSISFGDRFGKPARGEPGYFHVSLERGGTRVVIDLAQVQKTAVDPSQLAKILASSKLVASSEMTMDPLDLSTNITLETRKPVRIRVGSASGEPARLFIDLAVPDLKNGAKK